jgi:TPR repeat protein
MSDKIWTRIAVVALLLVAWAPGGPAAATEGPRPGSPAAAGDVQPSRFGDKPVDAAYGAFQRGLYLTALNLARPRAEEGDHAAQTLIAEIYARGLGVPRDPVKAAEYYAKAAEGGIAEAQFQYALLLLEGRHTPKDPDKAFALMRAAADAGNRMAQFNYAQMLVDREPGGAGLAKAVPYYELAARQGLPDAQYAMAQVYAHGAAGRPVDRAETLKWLERAARQNYDTAQLELGTMLVEQGAGEESERQGFGWLKRAAEGGNVAAQNRLAKLYRAGVGTEADPIAAAAWYVLARRAGLTDPEMDIFLAGLTSDEQKRAIELANRLR